MGIETFLNATSDDSMSAYSMTKELPEYLNGVDLDLFEKQVIFWKQHLDIAIEDLWNVKLNPVQHVIARECGNCCEVKNVESRGSGKTWLTAYIVLTLAVLNPSCAIGVVSATEAQATLVLKKLELIVDENENVKREIRMVGRTPVIISDTKGYVEFKNNSSIESFSINSIRGNRLKIIVVDEAPDVNQDQYDSAAKPVRNYTREIALTWGFKDFRSKEICLTSACEQSNPFYDKFKMTVEKMRKGDKNAFACALSCEAPIRYGLTSREFFEDERASMPDIKYQMEYETIFVGSCQESAFPYNLISRNRNSYIVETREPKNSSARYVICIDIATSQDKDADNTAISVIKFSEKHDATFWKALVYLKTLHGEPLDVIASEVRHLYWDCFPSAEKIIYDARGLGDSFDRFMDKPYVDENGIEHPPLVVDDKAFGVSAGLPLLHPFRANQALNQRMYINLRVALEKGTVEIPVLSRVAEHKDMEKTKGEEKYTFYQQAVFRECDALAFEMANIVGKPGANGQMIYDVPHARQHKDRYSSFAMAMDYVSELEAANIRGRLSGGEFVGFASAF